MRLAHAISARLSPRCTIKTVGGDSSRRSPDGPPQYRRLESPPTTATRAAVCCWVAQGRPSPPGRQEVGIQSPPGRPIGRRPLPIKLGRKERLAGLRIGNLSAPCKRQGGKLLPPAAPHRLDQPRIAERTEERKGPRLAIFLAHKQKRHAGRKHQQTDGQPLRLGWHERREAVAPGAIADLVVSLNGDDEPSPVQVAHAAAVPPPPERTITAVVDKHVIQCLGKLLRPAEILVIAVVLAGQAGRGRYDGNRRSTWPSSP